MDYDEDNRARRSQRAYSFTSRSLRHIVGVLDRDINLPDENEPEAKKHLENCIELLKRADRHYSTINEYIDRVEDLNVGIPDEEEKEEIKQLTQVLDNANFEADLSRKAAYEELLEAYEKGAELDHEIWLNEGDDRYEDMEEFLDEGGFEDLTKSVSRDFSERKRDLKQGLETRDIDNSIDWNIVEKMISGYQDSDVIPHEVF